MKRSSLAGMVMVLVMIGGPVRARAQFSHRVRAWVPFAFEAGGRTLPQGSYVVTRALDGAIDIASEDGGQFVYAAAHHVQSERSFTAATLVFHRINGRYYFNGVWEPGNETGIEVWPSEAEREAQRALAANGSPKGTRAPEPVYVSARIKPGVAP